MFKRPTFYLALFGVIAAVALVLKLRWVEPPPPPLAQPPSAPFFESIGARGIIESVDENVRIAPAVAGLISKVLVKVGDRVKPGEALLQQDDRDAAAMVSTLEAQLLRLRAQLKEAEVSVADRKDQSGRVERLAENRVSSVDEKQRAAFALQAAIARRDAAKAELDYAQSQLERSKVQLGLLTITAPRAGSILQVNARAGEYAPLNAAEPMILLGQTDSLQLRADVDEDNASRVRPGCSAVAFIKGHREHPIGLKFVRIEPYIVPKKSLTGESGERVDTRVLQVIFRLEPSPVPIYVGQQMDVFLDAAIPRGKD